MFVHATEEPNFVYLVFFVFCFLFVSAGIQCNLEDQVFLGTEQNPIFGGNCPCG